MIRKLFWENLALKAAAVVLAVILWVFVTSKGQTEMSLSVPIEYANIPPGLEISKRTVTDAQIVVRAHESLSKHIRQENVRVFVNVGRAKQGEEIFSLRQDEVKVPYGATVTKIEPSTVKVVFEETVSKKVSIKPEVIGEPEQGYSVKRIEVKPEEVVIEGAKSEVRKVGVLRTEPVDISGLTEDLVQEVKLEGKNGNIRTKIDKVNVRIRIVRRSK
ncbi:MAG TPA: CdaR family protein [Thermodesulfovibrionales bacterium]|nr:CdaR family protein [Thermodesulfovibrionales bacterium]